MFILQQVEKLLFFFITWDILRFLLPSEQNVLNCASWRRFKLISNRPTNLALVRTSMMLNTSKRAVPLPPCRRQGGKKYSSYSFLISAPYSLCPRGRNPGIHCIGVWAGLRAGLKQRLEKNPLPLPGYPGRPVCGETLYWLSCLRSC
jgi:hypothetical protein